MKIKQGTSIFHAPLKPLDTELQTEGCRHSNPDVCANNSLEGACAFVRQDGICMRPPRSWPKQYRALGGRYIREDTVERTSLYRGQDQPDN